MKNGISRGWVLHLVNAPRQVKEGPTTQELVARHLHKVKLGAYSMPPVLIGL